VLSDARTHLLALAPPSHCRPLCAEIQYGFLRKPFTPVHAFCYKRDPTFLAEIPTEAPERKIFSFDYTGNVSARFHLALHSHLSCATRQRTTSRCFGSLICRFLRAHPLLSSRLQAEITDRKDNFHRAIEDHPYCRTSSYSCRYGGLDAEGKPHVTGLAQFEQRVLEDLWEGECSQAGRDEGRDFADARLSPAAHSSAANASACHVGSPQTSPPL